MCARKRLVSTDLRRRNYSPHTIRGCIPAVQQFASYFGRSPEQLGAEHVRRYQIYSLHEKKLVPGSIEDCMSALRLLYKRTLKRRDRAFSTISAVPSSRAAFPQPRRRDPPD
jgi:site-specific recombinase XerD